uniref:SAP domain-containing protein n=1 Tax=Biomphalaria glabrata TaxID=6526 RepID=A0A2C9LE45_BIOGL
MAYTKLLDQLSAKELKHEIRERELTIRGNKETLVTRLCQALVEEEQDLDTAIFEVKRDLAELLKTMQDSIQIQGDRISTIQNFMKENMDALDLDEKTAIETVNKWINTKHTALCRCRFLLLQLTRFRSRRCRNHCFSILTVVAGVSHLTHRAEMTALVVNALDPERRFTFSVMVLQFSRRPPGGQVIKQIPKSSSILKPCL